MWPRTRFEPFILNALFLDITLKLSGFLNAAAFAAVKKSAGALC